MDIRRGMYLICICINIKILFDLNIHLAFCTLQLELWDSFVSKEDSECWFIFAQVYRIFSQISENKNLFQILGQTGFYIDRAHLAYFSLTGS